MKPLYDRAARRTAAADGTIGSNVAESSKTRERKTRDPARMPGAMDAVVLWLLVINLGIAFGAGIYEHRIVLPRWSGPPGGRRAWNAEAAREDDTGRRFWGVATTLPLTVLAAGNLYAAWNAPGALGSWWRGAATIALMERICTFAFFIPGMIQLMRQADSPESRAAATRWTTLNHLRHVLVLGSWIAALRAFGLFHAMR